MTTAHNPTPAPRDADETRSTTYTIPRTHPYTTSEQWIGGWRDGNDAGRGYALGEEGHTPAEAAAAEGLVVLEAACDGPVLAQEPDGTLVAICDAHGWWAVDLTAARAEIEGLREQAAQAGDREQYDLCVAALAGDRTAWRICSDVITDARLEE